MLALIIIVGILFVGFILLAVFVEDGWDTWATITSVLLGCVWVAIICVALITPLEVRTQIKQLYAFERTLDNARQSELSEFERAAIQTKIAEWNEWIAEVQYRNTWLINAVPDEVDRLIEIK